MTLETPILITRDGSAAQTVPMCLQLCCLLFLQLVGWARGAPATHPPPKALFDVENKFKCKIELTGNPSTYTNTVALKAETVHKQTQTH